jgi:LysM repeat protein
MDRKLKLAAVIALVGLTTAACAPNPYWQYPGASNYNRTTTVARAPQGGVTHNHCGQVHTHVLPPQGLAHHHGNGCMAGAATTAPPVNNQPPVNTYAYNPPVANAYTGSTSAGDYASYSTPKPTTDTNGSYYYNYTGSTGTSTGTAVTPPPAANAGGAYVSGGNYTVQKGDTVFQVMRNTGVYWKDIIRLNNLQGPDYTIQQGQTLLLK